MVRTLLLIAFLCLSLGAFSQTSLSGKVTDGENNDPILFGTVALYLNGVLKNVVETDDNGNYNFSNIDPGTYDVEASYTGYQPKRVSNVKVLAGKANKLNLSISNDGGIVLDEVVVVEYQVPLVEQDNTTSGSTLTSDQIRSLPTRNINALAATAAGIASADEGDAISIRGSRTNATDYYVDGIRVQGNLIPESEIDQLQVITGGIEARYGDVTGGIISITTKGPSNKFSGGIELETSEFLDPYKNSLVGFNLSGPILKNARGQSVLGYRLAGRYTYRFDDDPPAVPVYQVKDDVLAELEANPILGDGASPLVAADFLRNADVNALDAQPNENSNRFDFTAKLDALLTDNIDVTFTGAFTSSENRFTPGEGSTSGANWRLLNSHNNPLGTGTTYRGNFRFRHRLGNSTGEGSKGLIQNASYTLQFSYEKTESETADYRHEDRFFEYGHVGEFDVEWIPTFVEEFNPETQLFQVRHTDYLRVLRGFNASQFNPVLANYNNALNLSFDEALNGTIGNSVITNRENGIGSLLTLDNFIAPNGAISGVFTNSWNFHSNVGSVYNLYSKGDNDIITFNANANLDLVPKNSDQGRHSIQFGILYEERVNRGYTVAPVGLWNIARQQANIHIQGIEEGADTVGIFTGIADYPEAPLLALTIEQDTDNQFFRNIRNVTGQGLTEFVNVDGIAPDQLSLDLFSARELNDQGILNYFGFDYLGNPFDGTFDEFFSARDANGIRTFPVAPNRPIYTAAYIQDKFTFRDIIFRLGVRIDRYDANTSVLKDIYSLYEIMGAQEYHSQFEGERPGNIGDDFKVYLENEDNLANTPAVQAYRDGDQWYTSDGTPVNDPTEVITGGLVFPKYKDQRVTTNNNFIKSPDFDPSVSFEDYEAQVNIMPRLAFSFPISEDANFFAHYDILVQRPPSNTLATARDYFYFTDEAGVIKNNPNLRPERTIDYEVGFRQKVSNASAVKLAAYYKEMRDMIQVRTIFPVPFVNQYTTYDNIDFGTVKGFTFEYDLRRTGNVSFNVNYTLQFADGTGSNANSQRGLTSRGNLRTLFPLNFDERHRVVSNLDFRFAGAGRYKGPTLFGLPVFTNTGLNLQAIAVSGRPYTATITPTELGGATIAGSINGSRQPWNFTINLRLDKSFQIRPGLNANVYVRVSNLLDRRNIINVYSASGSASDDGFLLSSDGQDQQQTIENSRRELEAYLESYSWRILNPNFFSLPRRIFAGMIFDF
ncbi:MAG: TonB-dependent receptor [Bacteroidota bacterium]